MKKLIEIRGHHLLCIPRFYRGGYNKKFEENMKRICQKIRKNPDVKIKLLKKCDDICSKCPYKKGNICKKTPKLNYWILAQDENVFKYLNLKENSIHKARDIFNLAMKRVDSKNIKRVCKDCIYLGNCVKVGINNSFKKELNKEKKI